MAEKGNQIWDQEGREETHFGQIPDRNPIDGDLPGIFFDRPGRCSGSIDQACEHYVDLVHVGFVGREFMACSDVVAHPQNIAHLNLVTGFLPHLSSQTGIQRFAVMLTPTRKKEEIAFRVLRVQIAGEENLTVVHDHGFGSGADR